MFCALNDWANDSDARDLRRHCAHSDVTVKILHAGFYCSPKCKFNFVSAQPRLEFGHGWVIQFHWFTLRKLDIHTQIRINPCYWKEPISISKASSGGPSPAGLVAYNMRSSEWRVLCSYYCPACLLQTDGQTDGRTRWIQYTPPPTSLGEGIINPWYWKEPISISKASSGGPSPAGLVA